MFKLAPSILTADFGYLREQVQLAESGGADYLHLDVMDGHFVPNISFGPMVIKAIRQCIKLPLDVHLMIQNPDPHLAAFAEAGADIITVHQEATSHLHRTIQHILDLGCRAGVALNPATPIDSISEIVHMLDLTLVMSVNPGFGGQRFIESTYAKIQRARNLLNAQKPECELEVDGGVGPTNIRNVIDSGADVLVVGSSVYNDRPIADNIARLRNAYHQC